VREIHDVLAKEKDVGYTSALKLLQIMTGKGLVTAHRGPARARLHRHQPAETTKQQFAADVLQRVFRGSASQLMQHVLSGAAARRKRSKKSDACSTNTRGNFHESFGLDPFALPVAGRGDRGAGRRLHVRCSARPRRVTSSASARWR
jgi:predicted transcriptional regulator